MNGPRRITTKRIATNRAVGLLLLAALLAIGAAPSAAPKAPAASAPARVQAVTLAIRHRVFQNFSEVQKVSLQKEFPVGDTEYSARVIRFVPDFAMDLKTGKVVSRSGEPKNPAFQVVVKEKGVPQDTSWAFLNMPPHFGRKSLLAFKIARIDFVGRASIVPDTARVAGKAPGAAGTKP